MCIICLLRMVDKLGLINLDNLTTAKIPREILDYFRNNIPAPNDQLRFHKIAQFISSNYGLTPFQMMDDNLTRIIEKVIKEVKQ